MSQTPDAPDFNPLDPAFASDPFPILKRLRDADPVLPFAGSFIVTGHDPAWELLRRKDGELRWIEFQQQRMGEGVENEPYCRGLASSALMMGGDEHRRIRKSFQRSFRVKEMEALRGGVTEVANGLIDEFAGDGRCELVSQFANPLPLWAISRLLRVPHSDERKIEEWMQGFLLAVQILPLSPEQLAQANHSIDSLNTYFAALIDERRADPPEEDDLITKMIADADAGLLSEEELVTNVWTLFVGGHDTSKLTMCNAMVTLLENPEQLPRLLADPSLWPNAVEEVLRYAGPVQATHRLLPEEIELGDHTIPADTAMMVYLSAANHDESWCPHAAEFDATREVPSDHLAFGTGPHKCPGQHMGRMMVQVAVEALFTRLEGLRLVDVEWDTEVMNFRGPAKLELAWG